MGPGPKARIRHPRARAGRGRSAGRFNGARPEGQDQTRRPLGLERLAETALQWGPARRPGSDDVPRRCLLVSPNRLQWGPARRPGSDGRLQPGRLHDPVASMGPGPKARIRRLHSAPTAHTADAASMGPGPKARIRPNVARSHPTTGPSLQWGPARRPGSDQTSCAMCRTKLSSLQWGPARRPGSD